MQQWDQALLARGDAFLALLNQSCPQETAR